nr:hypothetical protein CKG001_17570 [Bdellovibrio sp. CKG001]
MNFAVMAVLKKVFGAVFTKKRVGSWIAAVAIAAAGFAAGMSAEEIKAIVADAPVIALPDGGK